MPISAPTSIGTNSFSGTVSGSTITMTTTANITAGNLVFVVVALVSNATPTISSMSDGTNSYTKAIGQKGITSSDLEIWYKANATAVSSGATITATLSGAMSGASTGWFIGAAQSSGVLTASPVDKTNVTTNNLTNPTISSGVLTTSYQMAIGASYNNNGSVAYTEASGFTNLFTSSGGTGRSVGVGYQIVNSLASITYQPTWASTAAVDMVTEIATFIGVTSPAASGNLAMMGM